MRKAKLSLIASITVGLLAITTAGVSTYAWYKTTVSEITTSKDIQEIVVSAPESFELASPNIYAYKGNGTNGYTGAIANAGSTAGVTVDDDFIQIEGAGLTNEQKEALASKFNVNNLWPGYKMSFAIKLVSSSGTNSFLGGSLVLDSFYPGLDTNRKVINAGATALVSNHYIAMAQAIKLYAGVSKTTTFTASASVIRTSTLDAGFFYKEGEATTNAQQTGKNYVLGSDTVTGSPTTLYYYLTIEFSNSTTSYSSNPIVYTEYKRTGSGTNQDPYVYGLAYDTPTSWSGPRYFKPDSTNGNSSCYESITSTGAFKITKLILNAY